MAATRQNNIHSSHFEQSGNLSSPIHLQSDTLYSVRIPPSQVAWNKPIISYNFVFSTAWFRYKLMLEYFLNISWANSVFICLTTWYFVLSTPYLLEIKLKSTLLILPTSSADNCQIRLVCITARPSFFDIPDIYLFPRQCQTLLVIIFQRNFENSPWSHSHENGTCFVNKNYFAMFYSKSKIVVQPVVDKKN